MFPPVTVAVTEPSKPPKQSTESEVVTTVSDVTGSEIDTVSDTTQELSSITS